MPSSTSIPRASSRASRFSCPDASKTPSTVARSVPVRTTSAVPRSPRRRPSAPTMMDLPAPVSPVRTLKPGPSGRVSDSMIAKFLMRSSVSMPGVVALRYSAPAQLLSQGGEEAGAGETDDVDLSIRFADGKDVIGHQSRADLPIHRDHYLAGRTFRLHGHAGNPREHQWTDRERVRRHRRDD